MAPSELELATDESVLEYVESIVRKAEVVRTRLQLAGRKSGAARGNTLACTGPVPSKPAISPYHDGAGLRTCSLKLVAASDSVFRSSGNLYCSLIPDGRLTDLGRPLLS